jgi:adenylate cyclase
VLVDDDGDLFGKHVVVAARIANLAEGGEILVSSLVRQIAEARGDLPFAEPRAVELRGIGGVEMVSSLEWSAFDPGQAIRDVP